MSKQTFSLSGSGLKSENYVLSFFPNQIQLLYAAMHRIYNFFLMTCNDLI